MIFLKRNMNSGSIGTYVKAAAAALISYDWEAIDCCEIVVALLIRTSIVPKFLIVRSIREMLTSSLVYLQQKMKHGHYDLRHYYSLYLQRSYFAITKKVYL